MPAGAWRTSRLSACSWKANCRGATGAGRTCASSSTCRPATGSAGFRKNSSGSCMSPGWRPVASSGAASTSAVWAASAGSCRRLWWPWTCPEVPPLEDVQLQFEMTLGDDEQRLDVQNLGLRLGEQRWPETRLQLTRHPRWHTWQARIDRLQLDLLGQWLPSVITHERTAEIIRSLEPGGELRNVLVSGAGLDRFRDWTLQAALHEGRVAARTVTPAMSG